MTLRKLSGLLTSRMFLCNHYWNFRDNQRFSRVILAILMLVALVVFFLFFPLFSGRNLIHRWTQVYDDLPTRIRFGKLPESKDFLVLSTSSCGTSVLETTMILIKSSLALHMTISESSSPRHLHWVIFTNLPAAPQLIASLLDGEIPPLFWRNLSIDLIPAQFHQMGGASAEEWKLMYRPCSTERLFLPELLPEFDACLFIDADALFLTGPEEFWAHFDQFNASQMAGLAPELNHPTEGWFRLNYPHSPRVGRAGINAGIILMNLTRMRVDGWKERLAPTYRKYQETGIYADQGIINAIFAEAPEKLYQLECRWNYNDEFCRYGVEFCPSAGTRGVAVLHHHEPVDKHTDRDMCLKIVYRKFRDYRLGSDIKRYLLNPMKEELIAAKTRWWQQSQCEASSEIFVFALENWLEKHF